MSDALFYANALEVSDKNPALINVNNRAAAELRRLAAENKELHEANEAFGKRQEWWNDKMVTLEALNAELVEALRCADAMLSGANMDAKAVERKVAAALAKVEASK